MSDRSTDMSSIPVMHVCSYCGGWHTYSLEMCRDSHRAQFGLCSGCPHKAAALRADAAGWVSVKERLPKCGENKSPKDYDERWLVSDGETVWITHNHPSWWNRRDVTSRDRDNVVTHWRPLPPAPEEAKP